MQRFLVCLLALALAGCSGGSFAVSKTDYRQQVRTLGVVPVLVDDQSVIRHPQRAEVTELLHRSNATNQGLLPEMLAETKGYFDVRFIAGDPRLLFDRMVVGRGPAEGGGGYRFDAAEIRRLAEQAVVDAVLVVVLHGQDRQGRRWDRTRLTYLEGEYNTIAASAAVVAPSGQRLWESDAEGTEFLPLQYPDFDEAYYNKTDTVRIHFVTVPGLERALADTDGGFLGRSTWPRLYRDYFKGLVSSLSPGLLNPFKKLGG